MFLNQCADEDGDGCLEVVQTNCSPAACVPGEAPACGEAPSGETCATAIPVGPGGLRFDPDAVDDDLTTTHPSCSAAAGTGELVFSIEVHANDTVSVVAEDAIVRIQTTCAASAPCVVVLDPRNVDANPSFFGAVPVIYTAAVDETIYVTVEQTAPFQIGDIAIAINRRCGDGVVDRELDEECDDGNASSGDGCDPSCKDEGARGVELCDLASPSGCERYPSLGIIGGGTGIPRIQTSEVLLLAFTVSEAIMLQTISDSGEAPFVFLVGDDSALGSHVGQAVLPGPRVLWIEPSTLQLASAALGPCGDGVPEPTGPYFVGCDDGNSESGDGCSEQCEVEYAFDCSADTPSNCGPAIDLGTLGDSDQATATVQPDRMSHHYRFEISEDVALKFLGPAFNSVRPRLDLELFTEDGTSMGSPERSIVLRPGTYFLTLGGYYVPTATTIVLDAHALESDDLGAFAPAAPIPPIDRSSLDDSMPRIQFTEDVVLTLIPDPFYLRVRLVSTEHTVPRFDPAIRNPDDWWVDAPIDVAVPAGTYLIDVALPQSPLDPLTSYSLSFSTRAP